MYCETQCAYKIDSYLLVQILLVQILINTGPHAIYSMSGYFCTNIIKLLTMSEK